MGPTARRVLLVDDGRETDVAVLDIAEALATAGFSVRVAGSAESAGDAAARFRPDLAVVSTTAGGAPAQGGEAVGAIVHRLRCDHGVPVIVVGAEPADPPVPALVDLRSEPADRGEPPLVDVGSEPAAHDERRVGPLGAEATVERLVGTPMVEQVTSLLSGTGGSSTLEAGDLVVDEAGRVALRADEPLDLTRLEFDLLAFFVRHRNRVLTREALLVNVWRNGAVTPNAIEAAVSKLRTKTERLGPRLIHTVRGVGYVLRVEGTSPFDLRRRSLVAERQRLVRQREQVLARREQLRSSHQRMRPPAAGGPPASAG